MVDELKHGPHARRMMAAYERMFAGKPEAAILRALGFFNHPAEPEALKLVLPAMREREYRAALNRLYEARLVLTKDPSQPVDCHPLIREHFSAVMRSTDLKAFQEGHSRLYEHYSQMAPEQPDTLAQMTPLFYAVYHGCQAGRHEEVCTKIYRDRIRRGHAAYSILMLCAFGADLSLLANFFEYPWAQPITALSKGDQAWLLNEAGFSLRALGRLADAVAPLQAGAELRVQQKDWNNAARAYGNLSELLLTLGQVHEAIAAAQQSVDFADQSANQFERLSDRTILADTMFQSGDLIAAQRLFAEAERMQIERQPEYPILYSLGCFRYCDLLLEQRQDAEVIRRATQTLPIAESNRWLLDIGFDHVSLGRAYPSGSPESIHHLNQAVDFLRQSGSLHHLPRGLLARGMPRDLDEVYRIATRSGMRLHLTDYHLASARLAIKDGNLAQAREHLEQAEKLVNETGYHRRDKALKDLRAKLGQPTATEH